MRPWNPNNALRKIDVYQNEMAEQKLPVLRRLLAWLALLSLVLLTIHILEPRPWVSVSLEAIDLPCSTTTATCRDIHHRPDHQKCCFVDKYCGDADDGIVSYLSLYFCNLSHIKSLGIIFMLTWLAFLFTTIGMVAGDFFSVNLTTIAHSLQLSDTLAGVTILALGNGSPDIFSTFAAISTGSEGMAIGELLGAAAFIVTVVAGSMALVKPFGIKRDSFLRDAVFLAITIVFVSIVLTIGSLHAWQCAVMVGLYVSYVAFVMLYHWWLVKRTEHKHQLLSTCQRVSDRYQVPGRYHSPDESQPLLRPSSLIETRTALPAAMTQETDESVSPSGVYGTHRLGQAESSQTKGSGWSYYIQPSLPGALRPYRMEYLDIGAETSIVPNDHQTLAPSTASTPSIPLTTWIFLVRDAVLPDLKDVCAQPWWCLVVNIMMLPTMFLLRLTVPAIEYKLKKDETDTAARKTSPSSEQASLNRQKIDRLLLITQLFVAPQVVYLISWLNGSFDAAYSARVVFYALILSVLLTASLLLICQYIDCTRWHPLLSIPGFVMSAFWLNTIASEVVALLKALGVIADVSEQLLGYTVFAVGNSVDDWVADLAVARHGHPIMAFAACFGGPLTNILIGLGLGGLWVTMRGRGPLKIDISVHLMIVSGSLVATLVVLMCTLWWMDWRMTRMVGSCLIIVWSMTAVANVVLEVIE